MNNLQIFNNEEFGNIRGTQINGEAYVYGNDVAEALGYKNLNKAIIDHVDEDDKFTLTYKQCKSEENTKMEESFIYKGLRANENDFRPKTMINESGIYALIFGSKLPTAKKFKHWVTSEVLPSIRKHGAYMTDDVIKKVVANPDLLIELATTLKNEREKNKQLEEKIENDKPKTIFADAVSTSKTSILIGDMAKLLKQNGIDIGQQRLFKWLRENGYLISRKGTDFNSPTQRAMDLNLFEIKETAITHSDGHVTVSKTSKVTGKGQIYFTNKFLKEGATV